MDCYRDLNNFEKCSKCDLKSVRRRCPAMSFGMSGSFYSPDPQCWKEVVEDKKIVINFNNMYSKTKIDKIMNKNNTCKCGNSKNMPFCDKSHLKTSWL